MNEYLPFYVPQGYAKVYPSAGGNKSAGRQKANINGHAFFRAAASLMFLMITRATSRNPTFPLTA